MALPKSCMTLLLWIMTIMTCCLTTTSASRFLFTLPSAEEECFMEEVDSRSSANQLLFRFGIIDPESYDFVDVTIKTPQLIDVKAWNKTQANYGTSIVRESGLYRLCFKKHAKSSNNLQMYYSFDFISSGTINVVMYANVAATLNSDPASSTDYTAIELVTKEGKATKMGLVDFPLSGASSSLMTTNTRVLLIVSVENVSKEKVDISIAQYPHKLEYPISWQSFGKYATHEYKKEIFDTEEAVLGDHIGFDVTEIFADALRDKKTGLTFTLHAHEDAEATLTGTMANGIDYYPQLIVEDMGLDLMREITYFKERVFSLRGEITYIKSKERRSRAAAESANSRVMWLSLFTNLVLMWIAMAQVLYIRKMLESSY